jgi:hypothetical protein
MKPALQRNRRKLLQSDLRRILGALPFDYAISIDL